MLLASSAAAAMVTLLIISLVFWFHHVQAMADFFQGLCEGLAWNGCVERISTSQSIAMNLAMYGVLAGLLSALLFFFRSKVASGVILATIAGYVIFGYLTSTYYSESQICELPDDKGIGEVPPAKCTAYNYAGPVLLLILAGWLVFSGTQSRSPLTLKKQA